MEHLYEGYLTEQKVEEVLRRILPSDVIIETQKCFKIDGKRHIVDFYFAYKGQEVIVEFNGMRHFNTMNTIARDRRLRRHCKQQGIKVVEIPYYVQLNFRNIPALFSGVKLNETYQTDYFDVEYPDGFWAVNTTCILPHDFNIEGLHEYQRINSILPQETINEIDTSILKMSKITEMDMVRDV